MYNKNKTKKVIIYMDKYDVERAKVYQKAFKSKSLSTFLNVLIRQELNEIMEEDEWWKTYEKR